MSERFRLWQHIRNSLSDNDNAADLAHTVMDALDSWIEENSDEEIKVGDTVTVKRRLQSEDGPMTDKISTVVPPMDCVEPGEIGEVVEEHSDGEVRVNFDCIPSSWNFHVNDLEKVHT